MPELRNYTTERLYIQKKPVNIPFLPICNGPGCQTTAKYTIYRGSMIVKPEEYAKMVAEVRAKGRGPARKLSTTSEESVSTSASETSEGKKEEGQEVAEPEAAKEGAELVEGDASATVEKKKKRRRRRKKPKKYKVEETIFLSFDTNAWLEAPDRDPLPRVRLCDLKEREEEEKKKKKKKKHRSSKTRSRGEEVDEGVIMKIKRERKLPRSERTFEEKIEEQWATGASRSPDRVTSPSSNDEDRKKEKDYGPEVDEPAIVKARIKKREATPRQADSGHSSTIRNELDELVRDLENELELLPDQVDLDADGKKKGKASFDALGHEEGAGAPCMKCGKGCAGLDLHYWRKICKNCKCPREDHDVKQTVDPGVKRIGKLFDRMPYDPHGQRAPLGRVTIEDEDEVTGKKSRITFDWIPPGSTADLAKRYMDMLPPENQPVAGTLGAKNRKKQIEKQLPNHDMDHEACHALSDQEKQNMADFVDMYKKHAVGIGQIQERDEDDEQKWACNRCHDEMFPGDVAVFADRAGKDCCWHPKCFVCSTCNELLVDLIYFYKDGQVYCGRHYADKIKPRCAACDELIFAREYTQAEEQNWHIKHFCCWACDTPLGGQHYVAKESKPYCLKCYEDILAKSCLTCNKKIPANVQRLSHKDLHWHATPECFACSCCQQSLLDKQFMVKQGLIFCSVKCKREMMKHVTSVEGETPTSEH